MRYTITFHLSSGETLISIPFDENDLFEIRQRVEQRDRLIAFTVSADLERIVAPWHVVHYEVTRYAES